MPRGAGCAAVPCTASSNVSNTHVVLSMLCVTPCLPGSNLAFLSWATGRPSGPLEDPTSPAALDDAVSAAATTASINPTNGRICYESNATSPNLPPLLAVDLLVTVQVRAPRTAWQGM